MTKIEQARAPKHTSLAAGSAELHRYDTDNAAVEHGAYRVQHALPSANSGAPKIGQSQGKNVSQMNFDMKGYVAEKILMQEQQQKQLQYIQGAAQAGSQKEEGVGLATDGKKDVMFREAIKKERQAMMALAETRRKIGTLYAQHAAKSMMKQPSSHPFPAGITSNTRGALFKDKATDNETGESFYVAEKTTGNLLMHDAMYKKRPQVPSPILALCSCCLRRLLQLLRLFAASVLQSLCSMI